METFKEIDIKYYDNNGKIRVRCTVPVTQDALIHYELMQSHYCKLSFKLSKPTYFLLGDFIETPYGRFELINLTKTKDNDTIGYSYEIQFDAYYRKFKNKILKYRPNTGSQEATFSLTSKISTHVEVVMKSMTYYAKLDKSYLYDPKFDGEGTDYTYVIDASVDANAAKLITYTNSSILDAIANIAQTFDCEWWFEGNILHFGTCENTNAIVDFKLDDNIVLMSSSQNQSTYANRVYAFGAARNLPSWYKNDADADITKDGVVEKRLMLPNSAECSDKNKQLLAENGFELKNGYIQVSGLREDQYVEGVTTNDDIYPRNLIKTSKVTSYEKDVEDESTPEEGDNIKRTFYCVNSLTIVNNDGDKTGDMAFRKSYILSGKNLHIVFQSGSLNGMDFECEFNPDGVEEILKDDEGNPILKDGKEQINPKSQVFEIVANEDYGRFLPDITLHPKDGDTFVLYNWDSTKLGDTLVSSASNELLTDAIKDMKKSMIDPTTYTCTAEANYSDNLGRGNLHGVGDRVNLYNKGFGDSYRSSRIIGYEFNLDIPYDGAKYFVGEKPSYSRLNAMESKIEELVYNGQSYLNNNGGGGKSIYIIKSYDKTTPTDYNVYSAKAVDSQKISRLFDDVAKGLITFEQGIKLGAKALWKITLDGVAYLKELFIDGDVAVNGSTRLGLNGTNTEFGVYNTDSTGARIQVKEDGTSIAEFDYITIRRAAQFRDITIRELRHIGGELAITPAAMVCSKVERLNSKGEVIANGDNTEPSSFKCYFETKDSDEGSEKVFNYFRPLDQARCQQFDIVADGSKKTRYYWRLVMSVGKDYIVLSNLANGGMDSLTTSEPLVGDNIVQLGYQGSDDPNRQSAIILSSTSDDAPSQKMYQGISSFSLDGCLVKDEGYDAATGVFHCNIYGDSYTGDKDGTSFFKYDSKKKEATFKGKMIFNSDSLLPDNSPVTDIVKKDDLKDLNIKSGNLLRNTSFCGDYESIDISEDTVISEDKETFSEKLKYWTMENASVIDTEDSTSGKAVRIGGTLSQQFAQPLLPGKAYVLSFKGKGTTVKVSVGGETHDVDMTSSFDRYELHITCSDAADDVLSTFSMVSTNCVVCEIMLSYGKLAPAWSPAYSDNDKSMAEFQNMKFLTDAITQGSTTIDGGLVMSQQFKVGNFRDKKMIKETGGMSGYYNDDDSPFLWGGGTLEQAIYTIQKYKDNPNYEPTAEELNNLAKFVVTHGGRAILTDIILRGIIYAEGGVMKSIKSPNGNFEIDEKGNAKLNGEINSTSGSIGGFEIGFNRIGFKQNFDDNGNLPNSSANQMSLYLSELIFNSKDRQAIIGCCTHYDDFLLRLIDTKRDMMPRYGGIVGVQGSADENVAMEYIGGWLSGVNFKNIICGFHHYAYSSSQPTMPTYKDYEIDRTVNCIYATTKCYWKAKDAKEESDANQWVNIKLPELKWYDDGHEILIKRGLCSDNKVNIQARRFCNLEVNYSDYGKPSYEEVWYDTILLIGRGIYVTEVELGSEMDSVCLRFFKDLSVTITNGDGTKKNYRGVWVEFKHPRDW
jgi:hypothetical protein